MTVLTDDEWHVLKDALDHVRSTRRRPVKDERQTVEAVVWRYRNGAKWRAVPQELGPWARAAHLHIRWSKLGVWQRVFEHLRDSRHAALSEVLLDGTVVRAHQKAAGATRMSHPRGGA